jgi:hypothetical protein
MRRPSAALLLLLSCAALFAVESSAQEKAQVDVEVTALAEVREGRLAAGTRRENGGTELALFAEVAGRISSLPAPGGRTGKLRHDPQLLVANGELAGLAWLEGRDLRSLAVRFARWDGEGWERPRTVAAPGPGSQLALAAARLADGSWLLAWSRYDGGDDEVVWSRSADPDGVSWSPPRRLAADNAVPDVTPALAAAPGGGAVAAWSRYDGEDYRVVTARFDGRRWSAPRVVGPAGSLEPSWERAASGEPALVVRTVLPRGRLTIPWQRVR